MRKNAFIEYLNKVVVLNSRLVPKIGDDFLGLFLVTDFERQNFENEIEPTLNFE